MESTTDVERPDRALLDPASSSVIGRALRWIRFDPRPAHRPPSAARVALAGVVAIALSLAADWVIARFAVRIWPSIAGYPHFRFADYSKLTVIGIIGAAVGWPIVTRLCAAPRWLYLRLAVLVTAVLLLPDLYIYLQGSPGRAVLGLVCMHLAIGVITYNAVVRIAPVRTYASPSAFSRVP